MKGPRRYRSKDHIGKAPFFGVWWQLWSRRVDRWRTLHEPYEELSAEEIEERVWKSLQEEFKRIEQEEQLSDYITSDFYLYRHLQGHDQAAAERHQAGEDDIPF